MSMKSTIRSGDCWSLYEDRQDENAFVYLQIVSIDDHIFSVEGYANSVRLVVRITSEQAKEMGLLK